MSTNVLGEIRAESDRRMLTQAFLETADYRTLIEGSEKTVVVGRRGTGKSALALRLKQHFQAQSRNHVIELSTTADQIIGITELLREYGDKYNQIKTASKIVWQCILVKEILRSISGHFKFGKLRVSGEIKGLLKANPADVEIGKQFRSLLSMGIKSASSPGERVANLAGTLELGRHKALLNDALVELRTPTYLIIDRLDEGYEPEDINIALIGGIVQGTIDINGIYDLVHPILFVRDNIFRAIQQRDPDYSRNIEGTSLRLHWDEFQLLQLVSKRLRAAFPHIRSANGKEQTEKKDSPPESDIKVWNAVTSRGLESRDGFRKCLRLTLYRPRDLLALLNEAFGFAKTQDRNTIIDADLQSAATDISKTRLDDLEKEYDIIFPGLNVFVDVFRGGQVEITAELAKEKLMPALAKDSYPPLIQQQIALFPLAEDVVRNLYSIGFFGVKDDASGTFKFCHDGRTPDVTLSAQSKLLIHPCYWIALNLTEYALPEQQAQEIHDDYEIDVQSENPALRSKRIGQHIAMLNDIPIGAEGAGEFHDWCLVALRIIFAGNLRNIEKHPNADAVQRRDIVASNPGESECWKRVLKDYEARQVLFEIKNFADLEPQDYKQVASYMTDAYGRIGFVIYRCTDKELRAEKELKWIREIYWKQGKKLIVMLSVKQFTDFLSKVRSPQKHDAIDRTMCKLLDTYHRNYLNEHA